MSEISLASKKTLYLLLTLLCIGIYLLCQLYDISLGPNLIKKYRHGRIGSSKRMYLPGPKQNSESEKNIDHHHNHIFDEDISIADKLYKDVKILCWIMTNPKNHKKRARHVLRTWGKRCNKILFMSTETDNELGAIALPVEEGRHYLWGKTKEAFKYIYEHHLNEYDWFLKADDDTYVIVENLRYMLYSYDPNSPLYFGCRFNKFAKQGYMSGGAGYILSRESVKRFVQIALKDPKNCQQENDGHEDAELGLCLEGVGVIAGDSRDENKRGRFFAFPPSHHLLANPTNESWYWRYLYYKTVEGLDCCSDYAISFHYIGPREMYFMDYFIYHLRPFGIHMNKGLLNKPKIRVSKNSTFVK